MAIRVLIVDDSATARTVLKDVLSKDNKINISKTGCKLLNLPGISELSRINLLPKK